ncbi:MAG: ABC transporter ATP-binding protein [Planctomycetia bacterium]|nr:ABC transporter ATP-binding protein [Planctomycetia bacterium]
METPFRRVFAPKDLWLGSARWAWAWSVLSTTSLCGLLLGCYLLLDLLINRGEVDLPEAADRQTYEMLSSSLSPSEDADQVDEKKPVNPEATASNKRFYDQGLRATAWNTRYKPWGGVVAVTVRHVGTLQATNSALLTLLAGNILLAVVASVSMMQVKTLAFRTSQEVATRLRKSLHRQTLRLGPSDLQDDAGEVAFLMFTGDVERVREGIQSWFERIVRAPLFLTGLLFVVLMTHWLLALQCMVPLVACWYLIRLERHRFDQSKRQMEDRVGVDLKLLAEGLRKTRLVRGFGMENFEHERFQGHLNQFLQKVASLRADERLSRWLCWMVVLITLAITLFLIGTKALTDPLDPAHLSVSAIVMFVLAFRLSYRPANEIWDLPQIEASAGRWADSILRYLGQIPEVGQAVGAKFLQPLSKQIQFESVTYRLPDSRLVLDRVDLRLLAGKITAVISLDPCEARALTYMLPRFIEPQSGRVLIDGEDLAFVTLESLRAEAIYVGGTDPFFTGTVSENLSCGDPRFTLQHVTEAAKLVHAQNFISKLPQGYETLLGEYGEQLDAGQSYRLGLARALLRDPALMIIEEPAERLDEDTKSLLDDTYARLAKGRTLIFLPSRLSTVRKADQVIFLHKGRIEAIGSYSKLITSSPLLRHWEYLRFNEFSRDSDVAE